MRGSLSKSRLTVRRLRPSSRANTLIDHPWLEGGFQFHRRITGLHCESHAKALGSITQSVPQGLLGQRHDSSPRQLCTFPDKSCALFAIADGRRAVGGQ